MTPFLHFGHPLAFPSAADLFDVPHKGAREKLLPFAIKQEY